jgi:hypothetical protein
MIDPIAQIGANRQALDARACHSVARIEQILIQRARVDMKSH